MVLGQLLLALHRVLLAENLLQQLGERAADMHLHVSELLITFILEYLGEERDLMVISQVSLDTCNDRAGPFNDERLQAILLVQIGVHELFHSLDRQLSLPAFLVVFYFLVVYILDHILELLEWQHLEVGLVAHAFVFHGSASIVESVVGSTG